MKLTLAMASRYAYRLVIGERPEAEIANVEDRAMSRSLENMNLPHDKSRMQRHSCDVCGTRMRIRLTGPEILAGNKQAATYICECGHEQSYVEELKLEDSLG